LTGFQIHNKTLLFNCVFERFSSREPRNLRSNDDYMFLEAGRIVLCLFWRCQTGVVRPSVSTPATVSSFESFPLFFFLLLSLILICLSATFSQCVISFLRKSKICMKRSILSSIMNWIRDQQETVFIEDLCPLMILSSEMVLMNLSSNTPSAP
jgi:hypothetical protein